MSRFTLLRHKLPPVSGGSSGLTVVGAEASGINRVGKSIEIYAGDLDPSVNRVRYTPFRDGVAQSAVTETISATSDGNLVYAMVAGAEYTLFSCTVEWSLDNGATWSAPVEPYYSFYPDTLYTEPSALPTDLVAARTSGAGVTPVTFTTTGTILPSCEWEIVKINSDFLTETYRGRKEITEYDIANLTLDLAGTNGPGPQPALPSLGATEILKFRQVTQDWVENGVNPGDNVGLAGPWVAVSATDFGGKQFYKLAIAGTPSGVGGAVVLTEVELAESAGGTNILRDVNIFYSPGAEGASPPGGATFQSDHMFDGSFSTFGALSNTPSYIIIDMLVPRPITQLRLTSAVGNYQQAPGTFTLQTGTAIGSYGAAVVIQSGVTWSSSANETKPYNF